MLGNELRESLIVEAYRLHYGVADLRFSFRHQLKHLVVVLVSQLQELVDHGLSHLHSLCDIGANSFNLTPLFLRFNILLRVKLKF